MPITPYENILPNDLFLKSQENAENLLFSKKPILMKTNYSWGDYLLHDSNPILIVPFDFHRPGENQIAFFLHNFLGYELKDICYYFIFPGSSIPWHDDTHVNGAMSIYLNESWDRNHGGLYLREVDQTMEAIIPKRNLGLKQTGGDYHAVSCLTKNSAIRKSIQVFF